jgi:ABC-type transporter Mla MlaB component
MTRAYLYVRGIGAALHRSARPDVRLFSRADLEQIDIEEISRVDTGGQAVIESLYCESCDSMSFRTKA